MYIYIYIYTNMYYLDRRRGLRSAVAVCDGVAHRLDGLVHVGQRGGPAWLTPI